MPRASRCALRAVGRPGETKVVQVSWERLTDPASGRLLLGFGHCLTIDSAQGITSAEHINALPRGSAGVTAFKAYVAESRHVSQAWTMISGGAEWRAEANSRPLGERRPVTEVELWARVGRNLSEKPYKPLGMDLLDTVRADQRQAAGQFIASQERLQRQARKRNLPAEIAAGLQAATVTRGVAGWLDPLVQEIRAHREAVADLEPRAPGRVEALRAAVTEAARQLGERLVAHRHPAPAPAPRSGPSMGF